MAYSTNDNYRASRKFGLGGSSSANNGRSWHLDRARFNKSEDYEVPMSKRKRYDGGGEVDTMMKYDALVHYVTPDYQRGEKEYIGINAFSKEDAEKIARQIFFDYGLDATIEFVSVWERGKAYAQGGGVRTMRIGDAVLYKNETWYLSVKNGVVGIKSFRQGAWGSDYPFIPLSKIDVDTQLTDMSGNKINIFSEYAQGGGIGFKGLADKVAKRYAGKSVAPKYQGEYGKRYSKSEAQKVGRKVAGKVYWQQRGRKFDGGGNIDDLIYG